ncbi:hypothetical protein NBM05_01200 [Rothia sp. AR01]|uniref:Uncharacterized protein n=1 Tax=Rothia santali TaxID=2949643 RepID=A0A9X2HCN8_9MICC|nr:hypothetical protein [Rothia santali]MCP3424684.1 hypothetical protein [Rothia santali]
MYLSSVFPTRMRPTALVILLVMALLAALLSPTAARAMTSPDAEHASDSVQAAQRSITAVQERSETLIKTPAPDPGPPEALPSLTTEAGGGIELPRFSDQPLRMTDSSGSVLEITSPAAHDASRGVASPDGVITYPTQGSHIHSLIPTDSGVQQLITLIDESAPDRYVYDLTLNPEHIIEPQDDGSIHINRPDGSLETAIAAPWAQDASGRDIPTRFEIKDDQLVQFIDHQKAENVAYPIVADPFWLAPAVVRCLIGIGINGPTITRIMQTGTPQALIAAGGYAALRCLMGR